MLKSLASLRICLFTGLWLWVGLDGTLMADAGDGNDNDVILEGTLGPETIRPPLERTVVTIPAERSVSDGFRKEAPTVHEQSVGSGEKVEDHSVKTD